LIPQQPTNFHCDFAISVPTSNKRSLLFKRKSFCNYVSSDDYVHRYASFARPLIHYFARAAEQERNNAMAGDALDGEIEVSSWKLD
jgi:hypothetical protein